MNYNLFGWGEMSEEGGAFPWGSDETFAGKAFSWGTDAKTDVKQEQVAQKDGSGEKQGLSSTPTAAATG